MNIPRSLRRACIAIAAIVISAARCADVGPAVLRDVPSVRLQAGLRYEGFQETPGSRAALRAAVRVTNETDSTVTIEAPGGCPLRVLLYRTDRKASDTSAVWDSHGPREGIVCVLSLVILRLTPAQSYVFYGETAPEELSAARVSAGSYQVLIAVESAPQLGLLNGGIFEYRNR